MKYISKILFAATAVIGLTQCESSDVHLSDVVIMVTPGSETVPNLYAGEKMLYSLRLMTLNDYVSTLEVTSFDPQNGVRPIYEDRFNQKEVTLSVPFTAPVLSRDSVEVELRFQATDNLGNRAEVSRRILVLNKAIAMAEKTGIVLYSPSSGKADALEFDNVSRPFSLADAPDSTHVDLYLKASETFEHISWHSFTKAKFLRVNSFDYSSASPSAIQAVYENSIRTDVVNDIMINDVIIVGHGTRAQGVFYVANVVRNEASPDCIQLSFKGISEE